MHRVLREVPWLLALALAALAVGPLHPYVQRSAYGADRTVVAAAVQVELDQQGWHALREGRVMVYYQDPGGRPEARAVAADAASALPQVARLTGLPEPPEAVVVLENSEGALQSALGWGTAEEALGVYWNGVVRVLSPNQVELPGPPGTVEARYRYNGPVPHELTHLVLDLATNGNYTSWYTEGLAQYVDYRLTGYALEPEGLGPFPPPYTYGQLTAGFYRLPDTDAAYAEALRLVMEMVALRGPRVLGRLDRRLAQGVPFPRALTQVLGVTPQSLFHLAFAAPS